MANFDPPIASVGGITRPLTTLEKNNGFQCGAVDHKLFNFLFQRIEAELKAIQDAGGIVGSDGDDTTVLQAILELISSATGGGDPSSYVTFPLAQARLPIFAEVTTNNGVIPVTDLGTGNIRIPAAASILHRGIRPYSTVQTDLATVASKIYHLRWNPTSGFSLKDLADLGYNPTLAGEGNAAFDSSYDDVLISRIQTNSSNVPAITNLVNKAVFRATQTFSGVATKTGSNDQCQFDATLLTNWSRTPTSFFEGTILAPADAGYRLEGYTNRIINRVVSRYSSAARVTADFREVMTGTPTGELSVIALA